MAIEPLATQARAPVSVLFVLLPDSLVLDWAGPAQLGRALHQFGMAGKPSQLQAARSAQLTVRAWMHARSLQVPRTCQSIKC